MTGKTSNNIVFGFGSNCNLVELEAKLGHPVELVSPAWCPGYKPVYRYYSSGRDGGALDMKQVRDTSMLTAGAIIRLGDEALNELDKKEGVAGGYYCREQVSVLTADSKFQSIETYLVHPDRYVSHSAPDVGYRRVVANGMSALGHNILQFEQAADNLPVSTPVNKIFVYGTLKSGELRESVFSDCGETSRKVARAPGRLVDLGMYPGLLEAQNSTEWVTGELISFENPSAAVEIADTIEGFNGFELLDNLFSRRLILVEVESGTTELAWVYFHNGDGDRNQVVPNGVWGKAAAEKTDESKIAKRVVIESIQTRLTIPDAQIVVREMQSTLNRLCVGSLTPNEITDYVNQLVKSQIQNTDSNSYGAWNILNADRMPADARVDFVYTPTYIAVAFLWRVMWQHPMLITNTPGIADALDRGAKFAVGRELTGGGYESESGIVRALSILLQGGVGQHVESTSSSEKLKCLMQRQIKQLRSRVCVDGAEPGWEYLALQHY